MLANNVNAYHVEAVLLIRMAARSKAGGEEAEQGRAGVRSMPSMRSITTASASVRHRRRSQKRSKVARSVALPVCSRPSMEQGTVCRFARL